MYNRTHYDHDNPPPKTVQGYKFNVFYPDLIDKTKVGSGGRWTRGRQGGGGGQEASAWLHQSCFVSFPYPVNSGPDLFYGEVR